MYFYQAGCIYYESKAQAFYPFRVLILKVLCIGAACIYKQMNARKNIDETYISTTLHPKNMFCTCCLTVIRNLLEGEQAIVKHIQPGRIDFSYNPAQHDKAYFIDLITAHGFEPIMSRDEQLVENTKRAVIELVHKAGNVNSMIRNSDYLVERMGTSYSLLSGLFSKVEQITLEKYIILHKIEKAKELIEYDEFTLSEIAVQLGYSSVQYLSNQFRQITGISVTEYKKSNIGRIPLDLVGKPPLPNQEFEG